MIKLSIKDLDYLIKNLDSPKCIRNKLIKLKKGLIKPNEINDEEYDILRDLCGDRLQIYGFYPDYTPTREGIILENLIDKLYIG